jgi:hypothetical protein
VAIAASESPSSTARTIASVSVGIPKSSFTADLLRPPKARL